MGWQGTKPHRTNQTSLEVFTPVLRLSTALYLVFLLDLLQTCARHRPLAFKKSTAWLKDTVLFSDRYNRLWRLLGIVLVILCFGLTLYYSIP